MYLVCGLGNKGPLFERTRHNTGYLVIEKLSEKFRVPLKGNISDCLLGLSHNMILAKPQTFVNLSGTVVLFLVKKFMIPLENLIIVHDDMDLEFGNIKIKWNGGDGGHRGVRSVIESLGSKDFLRLKIGIGRPKNEAPEEYVLSRFTEEEEKILPEIVERSVYAIETIVKEGKEKAMSIYNRKWTK